MAKKLGYIHIEGWMREELDLKGNELLVYALIHGFSQEEQGCFFGSLDYISRMCGCTRPTAIETLKKLRDRGLIHKRELIENNVKLCQYTAVVGGSKEILPPVKNLYGGSKETLPGGSKEILPNNKTIIENKSITKCKGTRPPLILPFSSDKFRETWEALCEEKNWKGKTQKALQLTLNKLGRYDEAFAIELMEKTIENGWKGCVFADTDAKYQEWMSARQLAKDNAVPRTNGGPTQAFNLAKDTSRTGDFYKELQRRKAEEERQMREEIEQYKREHGYTD
jgi:DNA-binding Lrp family transcriptional regulator